MVLTPRCTRNTGARIAKDLLDFSTEVYHQNVSLWWSYDANGSLPHLDRAIRISLLSSNKCQLIPLVDMDRSL